MSFCIMMIILDMGASTNFKELWANRNVVALAALSLVFQIIVLLAVVGAVFGLILAAVPYGMQNGRRDFASTTEIVAGRYDVLCNPRNAEKARDLLAQRRLR